MPVNPLQLLFGPQDISSLQATINGLILAINAVFRGAYGELVISNNADTLTLTDQSTWYPLTTNWVADQTLHTTLDATNGVIAPALGGQYLTIATVAYVSAAAEILEIAVFKNGSIITDHVAVTWIDTTVFPNTVTISGIDGLNSGDDLDIRIRCTSAAGVTITVSYANFSIALVGAK